MPRRRRHPGGGRGLGSDVYDKLLILKALKKGLPGAIFFTTDLDARYSLPSEFQETKNLIVASPFGLQLSLRRHERSAVYSNVDQ